MIERFVLEKIAKTYNLSTSERYGYLGRNRAEDSYKTTVLDPFIDYLQAFPTPRVLDIAAGISDVGNYLNNHNISTVGLDVHGQALAYRRCLYQPDENLVQANAFRLPFKDQSFSGVHMKDALVHIPFQRGLFSEISRVLVPDGMAVIVTTTPVPILTDLIFLFLKDSYSRGFSKREVTQNAQRQGLSLRANYPWTPSYNWHDWYHDELVTRQVFVFLKKR